MDAMMSQKLKRSLITHESYRKFPYIDTVGKITIGIGFNLSDRGIDDQWIMDKFNEDINYFYGQLMVYDWFQCLNDDRKIALVDMSFMGIKRLLEFQGMISCLERKDYEHAAQEILDSEWAVQVKGRAESIANAIESGVYNI